MVVVMCVANGFVINVHSCVIPFRGVWRAKAGRVMGGVVATPRKNEFFCLAAACSSVFLSVQCNSWHWTDIKSLECLSVCVFVCVCVCVRKTFRPR